MLRFLVFAVVAAGLWLLSGCGGGGGGGNGGGGGTANLAPGQYIEFFDGGGSWMDPFNLSIGNTGTAVLANYDALGNRTVLASGSWATTSGGAISINSNTGVFSVLGAPASEFRFQTVTNIAGTPTLFEQRARVPSATAVVNGRVTELNAFTGLPGNTGIPHLNVDFFDAGGNIVGSARTMQDGRFSARVPTTVTHMMIESDSIKTSKYYRSVTYAGDTYSPFDVGCRIPVGPLANGVNNLPSTMGVPPSSGTPPPPPTGCT